MDIKSLFIVTFHCVLCGNLEQAALNIWIEDICDVSEVNSICNDCLRRHVMAYRVTCTNRCCGQWEEMKNEEIN